MVKILLVEDELIIAEDMRWMLEEMDYHVIGNAIDYDRAIELLNQEVPDLILLDINLGGKKDGIDLAKAINAQFQVPFIFTTSHSDNATLTRAKEVHPVNYLVKPFKKEQLFSAIEVALFNLSNPKENNPSSIERSAQIHSGLIVKDAIFVKDNYKYSKLIIAQIQWIKADKNYLEIHTVQKRDIIRATLSGFIQRLNHPNIVRVHKSYAINIDQMTSFESTQVMIGETFVPVSKAYSEEIMKRLNII